MSRYSPGPIENGEPLARFIFSPFHVRPNGTLKPAIFSQVENSGCSVQRETRASNDEVRSFVTDFLNAKSDRIWRGVLIGTCEAIRAIRVGESDKRAVCIYDTAEKNNPAHAELFKSQHVISDDGDAPEMRRHLMAAFGNGVPITRDAYRGGTVARELDQSLRDRK